MEKEYGSMDRSPASKPTGAPTEQPGKTINIHSGGIINVNFDIGSDSGEPHLVFMMGKESAVHEEIKPNNTQRASATLKFRRGNQDGTFLTVSENYSSPAVQRKQVHTVVQVAPDHNSLGPPVTKSMEMQKPLQLNSLAPIKQDNVSESQRSPVIPKIRVQPPKGSGLDVPPITIQPLEGSPRLVFQKRRSLQNLRSGIERTSCFENPACETIDEVSEIKIDVPKKVDIPKKKTSPEVKQKMSGLHRQISSTALQMTNPQKPLRTGEDCRLDMWSPILFHVPFASAAAQAEARRRATVSNTLQL